MFNFAQESKPKKEINHQVKTMSVYSGDCDKFVAMAKHYGVSSAFLFHYLMDSLGWDTLQKGYMEFKTVK